jgi:hypothetical protein
LREKLAAEEALALTQQVMEERNMLVEELDGMFIRLRDDF